MAPEGVMVVVLPLQIVGLLTEAIAKVGEAFTLIKVCTVFVPGQFAELKPIIEYVVLEFGFTLKLVELVAPVFTNV